MTRLLRIRDERGLVHYARWLPITTSIYNGPNAIPLGIYSHPIPICRAVAVASRELTATDAVPLSEMCPDCCALLAREGVEAR